MCGHQAAYVAKVPSQFALSVMGREKLSIEILGHVSSKQTSSGNDWKWTSMDIHCNSILPCFHFDLFRFTHGLPMAYPFTKALLRLWKPASAAKAQRANGHAFLLGLGIVGPGKIIRTRLQNHLALCATYGKSKWIKKAQHGKTWIKHCKCQRVLQASKNCNSDIGVCSLFALSISCGQVWVSLPPPTGHRSSSCCVCRGNSPPSHPHMYSRPNIITENDRNHVVTCPKTLLPQNP